MRKFAKYVFVFMGLLAAGMAASAQSDRHDVRKGNRDFRKGKYPEAQIDYSKALIKDSASFAANYNLANTLYREDDMEQAMKAYDKMQESAAGSKYGDRLYYNLGNAACNVEDWQAAVDSYKAALLMNPDDLDAKENYIYAKSKLEEQENQDQNQDGDGGGGGNDEDQNDQDQDQNQDQNDQDQNQDQDQNDQNQDENQNDQNQDQNDDNSDGSQDQQPNISPQQAQQMLQAIQAKENETQDKVNREKADYMKRRQLEKNW